MSPAHQFAEKAAKHGLQCVVMNSVLVVVRSPKDWRINYVWKCQSSSWYIQYVLENRATVCTEEEFFKMLRSRGFTSHEKFALLVCIFPNYRVIEKDGAYKLIRRNWPNGWSLVAYSKTLSGLARRCWSICKNSV